MNIDGVEFSGAHMALYNESICSMLNQYFLGTPCIIPLIDTGQYLNSIHYFSTSAGGLKEALKWVELAMRFLKHLGPTLRQNYSPKVNKRWWPQIRRELSHWFVCRCSRWRKRCWLRWILRLNEVFIDVLAYCSTFNCCKWKFRADK